MKAEVNNYTLEFTPGQPKQYIGILVDGIKTNFWAYADKSKYDIDMEARLKLYCDLINQGVIKTPADPADLWSFDICAHCKWTPKKVRVIKHGDEPAPDYNKKLYEISGSPPDVEKMTARAHQEVDTQYTRIINPDTGQIADTCLVIVWTYGTEFYAI